jgi:hypothetical protein
MVMTEAAREALDGILVAAWYDKRFGDLGAAAASVLAMLLRLYAHEGRPPSQREIAATTGMTELETARLLTALHQHDLVILECDGATIRGAYLFTQSATAFGYVRAARTHPLHDVRHRCARRWCHVPRGYYDPLRLPFMRCACYC